MTLRQTTEVVKATERWPRTPSSSDLVMAWAVDQDTEQPRYILQLDAAHRGGKSNCKCPSCDLPLVAVNAAKAVFQKRPHFRHPEGAARERCVIVAARKALAEMFGQQERIVLPRRRRSRNVEGLSGRYFDAWVEQPSELELVVIAEFVLIYRFTGFSLRPAGPIPGAGRNQEKPDEEHEARPAPASRRPFEGGTPFPLGAGHSSRRQRCRQGCRYAMPV